MSEETEFTRGVTPGDGVTVKLGPLTIEVNDMGFGKVRHDGHPISVRGFTVRCEAGNLAVVSLDLDFNS